MPVQSNIASESCRRRLAGLSPVTFGIGILVFLVVLAVSARSRFDKTSVTEDHKIVEVSRVPSTAAIQESSVQAQPAQTRIEAELITLTPHGFEPVEITRPKGRFLIAVDNRSGILEITLRLDREAGGRLHEVRLPRGKLGWRNRADLPPGRYVLTEANHPEWACQLTITAR